MLQAVAPGQAGLRRSLKGLMALEAPLHTAYQQSMQEFRELQAESIGQLGGGGSSSSSSSSSSTSPPKTGISAFQNSIDSGSLSSEDGSSSSAAPAVASSGSSESAGAGSGLAASSSSSSGGGGGGGGSDGTHRWTAGDVSMPSQLRLDAKQQLGRKGKAAAAAAAAASGADAGWVSADSARNSLSFGGVSPQPHFDALGTYSSLPGLNPTPKRLGHSETMFKMMQLGPGEWLALGIRWLCCLMLPDLNGSMCLNIQT